MSRQEHGYLSSARVYLSGPMDFVASRAEEKAKGWRVRVKQFLQCYGATVFDPWDKPKVRGLHEYGKEDATSIKAREDWTFGRSREAARVRARCAQDFWKTMHIDLRMVDVSDFVIAYCPTNIYSVGTPHEIVVSRQQHKPVLFVSTPVTFPALDKLQTHLEKTSDPTGKMLLEELVQQVPVKPNPSGIPSLWYMPLIGSECFFDGFGFEGVREAFGWMVSPSDEMERLRKPKNALIPFLQRLNRRLPRMWNPSTGKFKRDDDWLLLDL